MSEFLFSVAEEIEALQCNHFREHARILQRLRARHEQLSTQDTGVVGTWLPCAPKRGAEVVPAARWGIPCSDEAPPPGRQPAGLANVRLRDADLVGVAAAVVDMLAEHDEERWQEEDATSWSGPQSHPLGSSVELEGCVQFAEDNSADNFCTEDSWRSIEFRTTALKLAPREEWDLSVELMQSANPAAEDGESKQAGQAPATRDEIEKECIHLLQSVTRCHGFVTRKSGRRDSVRSSFGIYPSLSMVSQADTEARRWHHEFRVRCSEPLLPISPHSSYRLAWDVLGMVLVLYETVTIPLLLLVLTSKNSLDETLDIVFNIYWTLDIGLTFLTCAEIEGELKAAYWTIASHYAKTWLSMDLIMVLVQWLLIVVQNGSHGGFAVLRILKVSRILRLLRVLKMENTFRRQLGRINSSSVLNLLSLMQMIFGFLILNHFIACAWFFIGNKGAEGWLIRRGYEDVGDYIVNGYTLAFHWAIAQFHGTAEVIPGNTSERLFAISMQVVGLLMLSVFVSTVTNMILQERHGRKKLYERREMLRNYFFHHKVSSELMLGVKSYLKSATDEKEWMDDLEVLKGLPNSLQKSVLLEARTPVVEGHCLCVWIKDHHNAAFRSMCHGAFYTSHSTAGTVIFEADDAWEKLVFVEEGHLRYILGQVNPGRRSSTRRPSQILKRISRMHIGARVARKAWICELALWVQGWQSKGDFVSVSNSCMLCLDSVSLTRVLKSFPAARLDIVMYAHGLLQDLCNASIDPGSLDDLWRPV